MDQRTKMLIKHLEMIQAIIGRMAGNSFSLKGWSVIIVSALIALDATASTVSFIYIAYLPALTFWGLDAYFLSQERYFRRLYDEVRSQLNTQDEAESVEPFSMEAPKFAESSDHWFPVMWSRTLLAFHGMVVVFITSLVVFLSL